MAQRMLLIGMLGLGLALGACGKRAEETPATAQGTRITLVRAMVQPVELTEKSVGQVDSESMPEVAAEAAGRVLRVLVVEGQPVRQGQLLALLDASDQRISLRGAQADVRRLQSLIANQENVVSRNRSLIQEQYIPRNVFDESTTQLQVLREQLTTAQAQVANARKSLGRARVRAPVEGRVQKRMVSVGDFVLVGKPLFQIVNVRRMRVHLPFPEALAARLHPGQTVYLSVPGEPGKRVRGQIDDLRPLVSDSSRAVDAMVSMANPGVWLPGASVHGEVVLAEHPQAVVVPAESVVARPAGEVVYRIRDGHAYQQRVKTGVRKDGLVEILSGVAVGEPLARDGAGFLTDGAPVLVQEAR